MNKQRIITGILILFFISAPLFSQKWVRSYGRGEENAEGTSVLLLSSGKYAIAGTWQVWSGDKNLILMVLNPDGTIAGQKAFPFGAPFIPAGMAEAHDGGIVIAGTVEYSQHRGRIIKIDPDKLSIEWVKEIVSGHEGNDTGLNDIQPTGDNGFLLGGFCYKTEFGGKAHKNNLVFKVDSSGNSQWRYSDGNLNDDEVVSVAVMPGKETETYAFLSCYTPSYTNDQDVRVGLLDGNGQLLSDKAYGTSSWQEIPVSIRPITNDSTSYNGYIIGGNLISNESDAKTPYFFKIDNSLDVHYFRYAQIIGGSGTSMELEYIEEVGGGEFLIVGTLSDTKPSAAAVKLAYVDPAVYVPGVEWAKKYSGSYGEFGNHWQPSADGGYVLTGLHSSGTEGWIWGLKLDSLGTVGEPCDFISTLNIGMTSEELTAYNPSIVESTPPVSIADVTVPSPQQTYLTSILQCAGSGFEPGDFSLLSPSDGSTLAGNEVDLEWENSSNAEGYDVYLGTTSPPDFETQVLSSHYSATLDYGETYYWKIHAVNDHGETISETWSFDTPKPPSYIISGKILVPGEGSSTPLEGVSMNGLPSSPSTDSSGEYSDSVENNWSGTVTPVKTGYSFIPESISYEDVTSDQLDQDYSALLNSHVISGTVTASGSGLASVTMSGLPGNPSTNSSGQYSGTVDYGWGGTVTPSKTGYTFTPASRTYENVSSDETSQNYTAELNTYTIAGTVTSDGSGLSGVTITGLPSAPATAGDGTYSDTVDHGWAGTASPSLTGYTFSPSSIPYEMVTSDYSDQDYTATLLTYSISGTVTSGGSGLSGASMTGLPGTPSTGSSGYYSGTVDYGWGGTVTPSKAGYAFTPSSRSYSNVGSNQSGENYTAELLTYTISGQVTHNGSGLANVSMTGLPGTPSTGSGGSYSGTVDYGWGGTVTPSKAGYAFTPSSRSYSNVGSNQTGQNYTAALISFTISGTVSFDGTGLSGVTITGLPSSPVTAGDGTYSDTVDYGWSGTAAPVMTGYTFTPSSIPYSNVTADQAGQNYAAALIGLTISGTVTESGTGLSGVTISGLPGTPATAGDGSYSDTVSYGWDGIATPVLAGYTFTPASRSYSDVTSDQTGQDYTADSLLSITGVVTSGGSGLNDVVLNGLPGAPATDASGAYTGYVNDGWSGVVVPAASGYVFTPESRSYIAITADQNSQDYTASTDAAVFSISGTIDDGTNPVAGVVLNGLPLNPETNDSGFYLGTVDSGWSGTVVPAAAGYTFSPTSIPYTDVLADQTNQDYTATDDSSILGISGHVTMIDGTMIADVEIGGLPNTPVTNPSGYYIDTVSNGWSGTAVPALPGYTFSPASIPYSNVTSNQTGQDYTATLNTYTIAGTVTFDSSGLADVTMNGLPGTPVTAGDGTYSTAVDHGWGGTVIPNKTGYSFVPGTNTYANVMQDLTGQDYTASLRTYTISGTVTEDASGLSGVVINGLPGSPVTAGDGTYSGTVEHGWSGTAVPAMTGYVFSPVSIPYSNVAANYTGQDYTATLNRYGIYGTVTYGGTGLSGVTITGLPGSPVTAGDGTYSDTVDYGWSGTAAPVLTGYTFTPANTDYSNVMSDQYGQDYTAALIALTISGTVTESGTGLSGVTISGLPGTPATAGDGTYSDTVSYGWDGTVTPVLTGYTFTPASRSYSDVTSDQTGQDYTADSLLSITGVVTSGGSGLNDVVLNGLPGNPATDASGAYTGYVNDGWSGVAVPAASGYVFTPESRSYIAITENQSDQDYTAASDADVFSISGTVDDGTNPVAGVVLNGLPLNPSTDDSGFYLGTVDAGWSGTVVPAASGYTFTPASIPYTNVLADQVDQDYTAAADSSILGISGHVTESDGTMIAGVEIGGLPNTPATNPSGYYIDTVSTGWSGTIAPNHETYNFTPADAVFTSIDTDQTQDFTAERMFIDISGTVTESGGGLADVVMNGLPGNPQTLGDGTYAGAAEIGWSGVVTPTLSGYAFTPETRSYSSVDTDQSGEDYTAAPDASVFTISGTVTESGSGLESVVMNGLPGTVSTAPDGTYSDSVDSGWTGVVTPALSGYDFTPASRSYSDVTADQTGEDYTATDNGGTTFTISGNVNDGTSGIADVVLNGLPGGIMTGTAGDYTGTVDSGWSGVVTPAASGWTFMPESRSYSSVSADQTDQDYTGSASGTTYSISGNVNDGTNGVGNVVMNGLPGNPATSPAGDYTGPVNDGWSGAVTPTAAGYSFTPENRSYSAVASDQPDQDYTAAADADVLEISGHVDDGANPVPGVVLNGLPNVPETNAAGDYMDTVTDGWSGTVTPALGGYTFTPTNTAYSDVTTDQTDQDYTAAADPNVFSISGTVTENGTGLTDVALTGLPAEPLTDAAGDYLDSVDSGWSGTVTPVLSGYSFEPESRNYSGIAADQTDQDYTASSGYYSSPSNYQVIPEVLWAPATGGGTWMTEVQITDITGGSEVSVTFNSVTGERRGPIALFTGSGPDTSVKAGNLLNTLDQLDSGFSYYGLVGAVEFTTQDADHTIHVIAKTKNGNFSKTFPGLNHNDDNTAGGTRAMMIQNLASNDSFRTAYGGFNPTDDPITVEYELIDGNGNTIGTTFTKTFSGRQYQAVSVFSEAGVPYPTYSYENVWLKITPTSGSGELMSYGATANNITSDPAVHIAAQAADIGGYNSPSSYQVIPEVLWAPATGGGTWMTEVQITDVTGGSEVSVYFNSVTGERRGPIALFTGSGPGVSGYAGNLLNTLGQLDPGYDYYSKVGTVEFVTQDAGHKIQVMGRTANGNYSKTFQGLNLNDANTASADRTLMVQNLVNDDTYRTAFGAFNPTDDNVTVEFTLLDENGSTIGTSFTKTFTGRQYQAFNPFTEAGVPYPGNSYNNTWIKVDVTSGSGTLMVYGATANNITSDPAVHRAVQH